jgi:hypothetical protein
MVLATFDGFGVVPSANAARGTIRAATSTATRRLNLINGSL